MTAPSSSPSRHAPPRSSERCEHPLARAFRPRPPRLGVDVPAALNLVGALTKYLSLAALFPVAVAIGYSERFWPYLAAGAIAAGVGWALEFVTRGKERVGIREGFLVVSLTWIVAAGFGALPYVFSGEEPLSSPINAYFEAMSGFTTTGASVVAAPEELPRSLLMWRQFTQWLGGMGIIVLALAVLPRLRVGGRQLFESELPGPELEPLATSIRDTAQRLWLLYIALTGVLVLTLSIFAWTGVDDAMSVYDAFGHAFTTLPTGGFGTPRHLGGGVQRGVAMGHRAVHAPGRRELRPALSRVRPR